VELDPLSSMAHGAYGMRLRVNHRYDEAIAEWQKALGLNPSAPVMHHNLAITYHLKGMDQQAFAEAKAQAVEIEHDAETAAALDGGYAQGGFREAMRRAAEIRVARSRRMYVPPSRIAELYALAGDKDRVLAWLRKSLDQHELTAMNLRVPVWDFLRFDPGFQEIFQRRMKPQQ
ncbi:MAG TPA: tetratricopeptide repeat protein, partial [Acidobacteriota bacterium]|nr:tetratricopeptide repeat protein [Acidobacteriota bacterium]